MIDEAWIEATLARMSVEEKVGQTLFPRVYGKFFNSDDKEFLTFIHLVEDFHIGGVELFTSDVYGAAFLLNSLQAVSSVPLLVTCDAETGIGTGLSDMALGLRLRYEIRREFAPYVGVNWSRQFGQTADYTRAEGGDPSDTQIVAGIRAWF